MQAMILAAGFGTRLLPFSRYRPKPLFPLLNTPLLLLQIRQLRRAGCQRILVNCHHLREQIATAIKDIEGVVLLEEETILGTGGGLRNGLGQMEDEPLLVINGDIFHTIDLRRVYDAYAGCDARALLVMHDCPRFNNVVVRDGRVLNFDRRSAADQLVAFTGIHVITPEILREIEEGRFSCIIDRYRRMLVENETIGALRVDGATWSDIGTPADYLDLHGRLLRGELVCPEELRKRSGSPYLFDRGAQLGGDLLLEEWCCVGRAVIGDGVTLRRSVVWDGAQVQSGTVVSDTIVR